ncbi:aminoglycoside phosphotransferase family protein [Streptomyces radicis]|uniref:Aminoglycoside phosphotransferase family protein n=1 Tax=Streptomyces radicis TaxID=1750517 RepID=A0A3A9WTG8_9ACTN|nr:aminoglycoside phosphotransferase family protein [Streptomyces radicis]RKN09407.1 aminoglycoside phosphotransferase family protein [Streptomyces radicis]RKN23158.1 aminoglycoside phosphotransferase family protein [Streptomyces radicis]
MASEFTEDVARGVLAEACAATGLNAGGAELLRLGSNAVFRLASAPVIVRIAQDPSAAEEMKRGAAVARWLASEDYPATRLVPGLAQPAVVGGRVVTYWESAQDRVEYVRLDELGDLLKRLHWLDEPESLGLSYYDPFSRVAGGLAALTEVSEDEREFLEQRAARLQKDLARVDFVLPFGAIHGDANVGNAIRHRDGHAILIDLDSFALGHREWDLVLTSLYYERFGWHTKAEYESFVYHYGFELRNWPGYEVLADIRELMMTLWLGTRTSGDPRLVGEFRRRLDALCTDGSRRDWQPF